MLVPINPNPRSREQDIYPLSRVFVTIGNYKKHPLSWVFSGNIPETMPQNTPFPEKIGTRMQPPYHDCIRVCVCVCGGGGGV